MNNTDNVDRKSASGGENPQTAVRLPYEPPALKCERLSLITRGGSIDAGDSGSNMNQGFPTNRSTNATPESDFPRS